MWLEVAEPAVIEAGEHLDARNVSDVRGRVDQALQTPATDVVLDMSQLQLIDAAGLGLVAATHVRCSRAGVHLVLRDCPPRFRRLLAVTRLNRILRRA